MAMHSKMVWEMIKKMPEGEEKEARKRYFDKQMDIYLRQAILGLGICAAVVLFAISCGVWMFVKWIIQ